MLPLTSLLLLGLASGAISVTLAKAHVTEPVRKWLMRKSKFLGKLAECPYCLSHWIAFIFLLEIPVTEVPRVAEFIVEVFVVVALATFTTGLMLRALLWHEMELEEARKEADELRETLRKIAEGE